MRCTAAAIGFILAASMVLVTSGQDVTPLLRNPNIVAKQIECVLQRGPCDFIGKQIKALLPEAIFNGCALCTPQQTTNAKKLIYFMQSNYPNEWSDILKLYTDPKFEF